MEVHVWGSAVERCSGLLGISQAWTPCYLEVALLVAGASVAGTFVGILAGRGLRRRLLWWLKIIRWQVCGTCIVLQARPTYPCQSENGSSELISGRNMRLVLACSARSSKAPEALVPYGERPAKAATATATQTT